MKLLKRIGVILLVLILSFVSLVVYENNHLSIKNETIVSDKFDKEIDNCSIVYFCDLHYGNYIKDNYLKKVVDAINDENPDLVIFGGDLIDKLDKRFINDVDKKTLTDELNRINSKYGKYAILGNHDYCNGSYEIVESIYSNSGFKLLKDECTSIDINNNTINLLGIDSLFFHWDPFIETYKNIDASNYTFAIIHHPDLIDYLLDYHFDYVLSGHSHGGQIYIPFLIDKYNFYGCNKYFKGKYDSINNNNEPFVVDVSNGVGRTKINIRLNAEAEISKYILMSK